MQITPPKGKSKTKYVSIDKQSDSALLSGRHPCDCQTLKHELVITE